MYYYNGDLYEGDWINDKREGQGTYVWKNGSKYIGSWKDDKKNGEGTLVWNGRMMCAMVKARLNMPMAISM